MNKYEVMVQVSQYIRIEVKADTANDAHYEAEGMSLDYIRKIGDVSAEVIDSIDVDESPLIDF